MNRRVVLALFALLCVAQLGAVVSMIARYESTLRSGTPYKIEVAPVDPSDAFRGRYVAILPRLLAAEPQGGDAAARAARELLGSLNRTVHVTLETGPDGFARVREVSAEPPASGDYLSATTAGARHDWGARTEGEPVLLGYDLNLPFDRYYMKETVAPAAESAYRDAARRGQEQRAWVVVRVRNGMGAVEGLFIDGKPIEEVVAAAKAP